MLQNKNIHQKGLTLLLYLGSKRNSRPPTSYLVTLPGPIFSDPLKLNLTLEPNLKGQRKA